MIFSSADFTFIGVISQHDRCERAERHHGGGADEYGARTRPRAVGRQELPLTETARSLLQRSARQA